MLFPAGCGTDLAGNYVLAGTTISSVIYNTIGPSLQVIGLRSPTNAYPIFQVTFSESVVGFSNNSAYISLFAVFSNARTLSVSQGSQNSTVFNITVIPVTQGAVTLLYFPANLAFDSIGNGNLAATNAVTVLYASIGPVYTIASLSVSPSNSNPVFSVTFDQNVIGFGVGGSLVALLAACNNALSVSVVAASGSIQFTVSVTPASVGNVTFQLPANVAFDSVGNGNLASINSVVVFFDNTPPIASLNLLTTSPNHINPSFLVLFNKPVLGFTQNQVAGILKSSISPSPFQVTVSSASTNNTMFLLTISPSSQGLLTVIIPRGVAIDSAGNVNVESNTASFTFDTIGPIFTVTTGPSPTNQFPVFTVTFDAPVADFAGKQSVVLSSCSNALNVTISGSGSTYFITVTPLRLGSVSLQLPAGISVDAAGNPSLAQISPAIIMFNNQGPVPTIIVLTPLTNQAPSFEIVWNQNVVGFNDSLASSIVSTSFEIQTISISAISKALYICSATPPNTYTAGLINLSLPVGLVTDSLGTTMHFYPDVFKPSLYNTFSIFEFSHISGELFFQVILLKLHGLWQILTRLDHPLNAPRYHSAIHLLSISPFPSQSQDSIHPYQASFRIQLQILFTPVFWR